MPPGTIELAAKIPVGITPAARGVELELFALLENERQKKNNFLNFDRVNDTQKTNISHLL